MSTSAMELGLDIGEIDLVVIMGLPPSQKAFWQRLGRAGRKREGVCLLIDSKGALTGTPEALSNYVCKDLEPSWLYLENRYLQYANVLCAAAECSELGIHWAEQDAYKTLPSPFARLLENELNPTEVVPADIYPLKQQAQAGPHREFPLRSGIETDFKVGTPQGLQLGNLTLSQMMRRGLSRRHLLLHGPPVSNLPHAHARRAPKCSPGASLDYSPDQQHHGVPAI